MSRPPATPPPTRPQPSRPPDTRPPAGPQPGKPPRRALLKPRDAAAELGISENGVYRMIAAGQLRAVDMAQPGARTSKTRIRSDDLLKFIESRTSTAPRRSA